MLYPKLVISLSTILILVSACSSTQQDTPLINDSKENEPSVKTTVQTSKNIKNDHKLRILQLGDSHTAADFFTDEIRQQLQAKFGNGGIGIIPPYTIRGQRTATMKYSGYGWNILTSRKDSADFPLGGVVASPDNDAQMTLTPRIDLPEEQNITFLFKYSCNTEQPCQTNPLVINSNNGTQHTIMPQVINQWTTQTVKAYFPITYSLYSGEGWQLSWINVENTHKGGVVVSTMGINGSQLSQWDRWHSNLNSDLQFTKADIVILAYGTNEAFDDDLDIQETKEKWIKRIHQIKQALPNAKIIIIGAPESLKSKQGLCGTRPLKLDDVQQMQRDIAQQEGLGFWSWQDAMGGECTMKEWMAQGMAQKDGVHFTRDGYKYSASLFVKYLLNTIY